MFVDELPQKPHPLAHRLDELELEELAEAILQYDDPSDSCLRGARRNGHAEPIPELNGTQ